MGPLGLLVYEPEDTSAENLLRVCSVRWQIENSLHWIGDVVFSEDASTTRTDRAPQALAALRNLAVSLLHRWRRRDVTAARQFFAAHSSALLQRLTGSPRRL